MSMALEASRARIASGAFTYAGAPPRDQRARESPRARVRGFVFPARPTPAPRQVTARPRAARSNVRTRALPTTHPRPQF
jgi:hypothetical protein